jgi:hypothetical protein
MKKRSELAEFRAQIRQVVADYMHSEGCGCCSSERAHDEAKERLAKLLRVPKYSDSSGHDFTRFRSQQ